MNHPNHRVLDVYGGVLRLHPACTPLEWLESLNLVTPATLQLVQYHRALAAEQTKAVTAMLSIKIRKGHSCSSLNYHDFLQRLAPKTIIQQQQTTSSTSTSTDASSSIANTNDSVALQPDSLVVATVESSHAVGRRGATVTQEGQFFFPIRPRNVPPTSNDCYPWLENAPRLINN
jgi:hypothetical protein